MYKIALVCENGASTGLCVQKMIAAAEKMKIEAEIGAYSFAQLDTLLDAMDVFMISPQLSYRMTALKNTHPEQAHKFTAINPMDFGMMDGEKILKDAMTLAETNR